MLHVPAMREQKMWRHTFRLLPAKSTCKIDKLEQGRGNCPQIWSLFSAERLPCVGLNTKPAVPVRAPKRIAPS